MSSEEQPVPDFITKLYDTHVATYKKAGTLDINLDVHVPKGAAPNSTHPLVVFLHGGGLITGHRRHLLLIPGPWLFEWAHEHSAIVVSASYRLAPQTRVTEIRQDCLDLFTWIKGSLNSHLSQLPVAVTGDLSRIVLRGDSAGAWGALHIALEYPDDLRVLNLAWPMIDLGSDYFIKGAKRPVMGVMLDEAVAESLVVTRIEGIKGERTFGSTSGDDDIQPAGVGAFIHGLMYRLWKAPDEHLLVLDKIVPGKRLPKRVWLEHGIDDSIVTIEGSKAFEALVRDNVEGTDLRVDFRPGEHGFDLQVPLSEQWLAQSVRWVEDAWLA